MSCTAFVDGSNPVSTPVILLPAVGQRQSNPNLGSGLQNQNLKQYRMFAATALGKMGSVAAVPALDAAAQSSPGILRLEAQHALKLIAQR